MRFTVFISFISVVPSQFWPLLKNTKSGLSGNRPITVHGNLTSVPGGISLNGRDQYLDGGDFHGKCISDPDKCSKGLSVAIQVCITVICCFLNIVAGKLH